MIILCSSKAKSQCTFHTAPLPPLYCVKHRVWCVSDQWPDFNLVQPRNVVSCHPLGIVCIRAVLKWSGAEFGACEQRLCRKADSGAGRQQCCSLESSSNSFCFACYTCSQTQEQKLTLLHQKQKNAFGTSDNRIRQITFQLWPWIPFGCGAFFFK